MAKLESWERFKDARLVHNMHSTQTMDDVAAATGLTKNMISDLENENRNRDVGYKNIAILAKHYGVSADYLLGLSEDPSLKPSPIDELGLTPESVKMINNLGSFDNGKDLLKGLNMLLEGTNLYIIAEKIKELADSVQADTDKMEQILSGENDHKDILGNRPSAIVSWNNMELASNLEKELVARHPELAGRITIECGRFALERKLKDIMELIEMQIKFGTGYIDYEMQSIIGKK